MTTYLRKPDEGSKSQITVDGESWDLDVQLDSVHTWLREHPEFNPEGSEWVVDIGFEPRKGVVAGYTVSVELMAILSQKNVTLWLSDYSEIATEDA